MLAFTVAGDMDRVVEQWLVLEAGDLAKAGQLQQLVEVVVMVRAAVQARGLTAQARPGGHVADALARYAGLLAAQGSLGPALSYLGQSGAGAEGGGPLAELKERLERSLARPAVQAAPAARPSSRQPSAGPASRKASLDYQQQFKFGAGASSQQPGHFQPAAAQPAPPSLFQPQEPLYPAPPVEQPRAAPSSNPLLGGRRTVDPSIAPGQQYQQSAPSQYQPGASQYQPGAGQYAPFQPAPEPQPAAPAPHLHQPTSIFNPAAAVESAAAPSFPPQAAPMERQPDQPGPGFSPPVSSGYGWNDPPPASVAKNAFSRRKAPTMVSSEPMQPIFTPAPTAAAAAPTPSWGGFQPGPALQSGLQPGAALQPAFQPGPALGSSQPAHQPSFAGFQPSPAPAPAPPANQPAAAPEPQPPAPIPAEHQVIQDVMESLRSKCLQASSHPQIRRKLEDVSTRLDTLYSKLRAGSLSQPTLTGLHAILQHVWHYDYPACMQVIAGLIAGGSFAEMSDFMPGVKVLLQVAQQQGVYVEYQQQ